MTGLDGLTTLGVEVGKDGDPPGRFCEGSIRWWLLGIQLCQSVIIVEALCKIRAADIATMAAGYTESMTVSVKGFIVVAEISV